MKYRITFYDNFYRTYKLAYDSTLYDLLRNFGFWMDSTCEWYLHRRDGERWTLIGRNAEVNRCVHL